MTHRTFSFMRHFTEQPDKGLSSGSSSAPAAGSLMLTPPSAEAFFVTGSEMSRVQRHLENFGRVEVARGWKPIVDDLDAQLSGLDARYRLAQLHAHHGMLLVDWRPGREPGLPEQGAPDYEARMHRYLSSVARRRRLEWESHVLEAGRALIEAARHKAEHTCEECGSLGWRYRLQNSTEEVCCSRCISHHPGAERVE